jgi:hypothetical protein
MTNWNLGDSDLNMTSGNHCRQLGLLSDYTNSLRVQGLPFEFKSSKSTPKLRGLKVGIRGRT